MHRVKYQSEQTERKRNGVKWGPFFRLLKLSGSSAWALHHFCPAVLHLTLLTLPLSPKLIGCQSPWQPGIAQLHYWLGAIHAHLFTQQCHVHLGASHWALWSRSLHAPNWSMFMCKKFASPVLSLSLFFFKPSNMPVPTPPLLFPSAVPDSRQNARYHLIALFVAPTTSCFQTSSITLTHSPQGRRRGKKNKKEIPV